jgi:hypothetical protein
MTTLDSTHLYTADNILPVGVLGGTTIPANQIFPI